MVEEQSRNSRWWVLAAVGSGVLLGTVDGSIINVAMPTLVRDFETSLSVVQWVVLSYLVALTALTMTVGRLADMVGKKVLYAGGFVVFTVASALCGLAPSIHALIALRVVQGIGGAMITTLGAAIVTETFDRHDRGMALGIIGSLASLGLVLGPTAGGFLLSTLSWHWIFFVNVPIGLVGIALTVRFVARDRPREGQRFDIPGTLTLLACLLSLLFALTTGQRQGFSSAPAVTLFVVAAAALGAFLRIEARAPQPAVDLRLFRNRTLAANLLGACVVFVCMSGVGFLLPFYLENVLHHDLHDVGLLLSVLPVSMGVVAPLAGRLSDRTGSRPITLFGLTLLCLGYLQATTLGTQTTTAHFVATFVVIGVAFGFFQSPNNSMVMGAAPEGQAGVVSGLLALTKLLGQTGGVAVLGALWAGQVTASLGGFHPMGPSSAPPEIQVNALQHVFQLVAALVLVTVVASARAFAGSPLQPGAAGDAAAPLTGRCDP